MNGTCVRLAETWRGRWAEIWRPRVVETRSVRRAEIWRPRLVETRPVRWAEIWRPRLVDTAPIARHRRFAVGMVVLAGAASLVCSAPASALLSRGHVFAGTFEGAGAQVFGMPSGVAVDEASGDVYVADPAHDRVERFKRAAGGYEFAGEFEVAYPGAIAIDNSSGSPDPSSGDVYVAGAGSVKERKEAEEAEQQPERNYLYKFTASGEMIFKKRIFKAKEEREESGEKVVEQVEKELERISGLAVDATGKLWVYWGETGNISGFGDDETNKLIPSLGKEEVLAQSALEEACSAEPGFAVGPGDEVFYVAHERETGSRACPEEGESGPRMVSQLAGSGKATERSIDNQDGGGVALDPADGEVYVDNVGSVAVFGADGSFIQRFGAGQLSGAGALAIDSAQGIVYVAEPGKIAVFAPEGAGAPTIDSVSAHNLTPGSERVNAQIDPRGARTTYRVQYGTVSCAEPEASCTDTAEQEVGSGQVAEGFADVAVQTSLQGLQSNTTYYYRVIAENEHGTAQSPQSTQTFFTTLPSAEGVLPDHRQWQLVSPADMRGATPRLAGPEAPLIQASADGDSLTWGASAPPGAGEAEGYRAPEPLQVMSRRGSEEWSSNDISTPRNRGGGIEQEGPSEYRFFSPDLSLAVVEPEYLLEPLENPPLAPEAREKTIYRRNEENGGFQPLVTAANDLAGVPFGGKLSFQGATTDVQHVVFKSEVPLVSGAGEHGLYEWEAGAPLKLVSVLPGPEATPASEPNLGYRGYDVRGAISQEGSRVFWTNEEEKGPLYMRDPATKETKQINAAQGVKEAGEEEIADNLDEVYFQAASSDGSRVFFTDTWPLTGESSLEPTEHEESHPADLYEFNTETGNLSDLSVDQNVGEKAEVLGTLPGISEDGSYVYFVANGVLAPGAEKPGDCPREDPFRNGTRDTEGECNLYVSEPDPEHPGERETRFIARLSEEDANDWGEGEGPEAGELGGITSQVSSNGRYLAFMSDRDLTGYDSADADPAAKGADDEEVFLYDAGTGRLVCASCNPSGQAPDGVFDTSEAGEGFGLTVDRPRLWRERWLAGSIPGWTPFDYTPVMADHQSRYLSNDGRLFFDSADALVGQVQATAREETVDGKLLHVGVENVYEYEPVDTGSCREASGCVALISSGTSERESAFLDASETGNDVFFVTAAKLVAQATEPNDEIYDAAVCSTGETQPCLPAKEPPPEECAGEGCRAASGPQLTFQAPPTSTSSPPANSVQQTVGEAKSTTKPKAKPSMRSQKLANALKACRKLRRKKLRQTCERKARKAYDAKVKPTKTNAKPTNANAKPTNANAKPTNANAKPTNANAEPTNANAKRTPANAKRTVSWKGKGH
jgi:DNA-binding beta-propeller fold protein YncE